MTTPTPFLWRTDAAQTQHKRSNYLIRQCIRYVQRRARQAVPDRVQQECCTRACTEVFTARPGMPSPLEAFRQSANCKKLDLRLRGGDVGRAEMTGMVRR